jgi:hypothetical protein
VKTGVRAGAGKRTHHPIAIVKEWDANTPIG